MRRIILSPAFLFALILLLVNDLFLKQAYHNLLTDKLSDFAGLFVFPLFIFFILGEKKFLIFILTGIFFILWKSPVSNILIESWNSFSPYRIYRVIDYTDLLALIVLPFGYYYKSKLNNYSKKTIQYSYCLLIPIICFSIIATAGTKGNIQKYTFVSSKKDVNKAFKILLQSNPDLKISDSLLRVIHYNDQLKEPLNDKLEEISADSVSFYVLSKASREILWLRFPSTSKNWEENECELYLISVIKLGEMKKKYEKDLTTEQKKKVLSLSKSLIIDKLQILLNKPIHAFN